MLTQSLRAVLLCLAGLSALTVPAAAQPPATGRVIGYAYTANNSAIADASIQLRNTVSGQVDAVTRTNAVGEFVFDRVPPGSYVIEMLNASSGVLALGHPFSMAAGESVATFVRIGNAVPIVVGAGAWELAFGVTGTWRDGSDDAAPGGGVAVGYRRGRVTPFLETSGARRDGHNDWRAVGGLRLWLKERAAAGLYAHGSVGALIRNSDAGAAVAAGVGVEWRIPGRLAVRVQGDLARDRADGVTATGARASAWVVRR